ncbi:AAA family ATPase [Caldimonas tepidiphila]|uniref:AAA family ATPase n=1 Tax=Caldimonas tepidiphila TaxID=2315841 RepID=UPI0013008A62|nr:AAA family ATPase [Caldimonas tepidiphila]
MKIKVVSSTQQRAEAVARMVRESAPGLEVLSATGAPDDLVAAVNGSQPSLLVLDGLNQQGLDGLGALSGKHPELEAIVISPEPSPAFLLRAMQVGVRDVLPSADPVALQAAVQRISRKHAPAARGEVLAFMGCKGGSGATFLAANLAHVLSSREGLRVALLDLDLQFGDALLMLSDQRPASDVAEVARDIHRLDAELLRAAMVSVSPTLSVLAAPTELSQALEIKASDIEAIVKQARQVFDYVVLDVGRSIDPVSLQALDLAQQIYPVVQLSLPQLRDARRLRTLFQSLGYPPDKLQWLVNRYQKSTEIGLEAFEQAVGNKDLLTVPNHFASVSASVNQGVPIEKLARSSPVTRALLDLAQVIAPVEAGKKDKWFRSLFSH